MRQRWKQLGPVLKVVLTAAILVAVGRQFARDLQRPDLWQRPIHLGWLVLAGLLYPFGLALSALYWGRLLRAFGERPSTAGMLRAYYIAQLGKYLPGKAWALAMRVGLARADGVRLGAAALTSTYEVLATMAAGVLLAAVLFALLGPAHTADIDWAALRRLFLLQAPEKPVLDRKVLALLALGLLVPFIVVIAPPVFNRLMHRLARPFRKDDSAPLPRLRWPALLQGLTLPAVGWLLLGASLLAVFHAIMPDPPAWTWRHLGLYTAYLTTAYVAGFVIVLVPGGLGVREFFLTLFLVPELAQRAGGDEGEARAFAVLAVLLLRLVWTVAELLTAGALYLLPSRAARSASKGASPPLLALRAGEREQEDGDS
jgi:uncharacterized membrane protein YbhN (UPF0104 family)